MIEWQHGHRKAKRCIRVAYLLMSNQIQTMYALPACAAEVCRHMHTKEQDVHSRACTVRRAMAHTSLGMYHTDMHGHTSTYSQLRTKSALSLLHLRCVSTPWRKSASMRPLLRYEPPVEDDGSEAPPRIEMEEECIDEAVPQLWMRLVKAPLQEQLPLPVLLRCGSSSRHRRRNSCFVLKPCFSHSVVSDTAKSM